VKKEEGGEVRGTEERSAGKMAAITSEHADAVKKRRKSGVGKDVGAGVSRRWLRGGGGGGGGGGERWCGCEVSCSARTRVGEKGGESQRELKKILWGHWSGEWRRGGEDAFWICLATG